MLVTLHACKCPFCYMSMYLLHLSCGPPQTTYLTDMGVRPCLGTRLFTWLCWALVVQYCWLMVKPASWKEMLSGHLACNSASWQCRLHHLVTWSRTCVTLVIAPDHHRPIIAPGMQILCFWEWEQCSDFILPHTHTHTHTHTRTQTHTHIHTHTHTHAHTHTHTHTCTHHTHTWG